MAETDGVRTPEARLVAAGAGWRVSEFVCEAGPDDRPFEERHDCVAIAAVLSGSFRYRTRAGSRLMHPGAFMFGEAGCCYECGHEHSVGDRCLAFHFSEDYFDEIAHAGAGRAGYRFTAAALPAAAGLLPLAARVQALDTSDPLAVEDLSVRVAYCAVRAAEGEAASAPSISARDESRVALAMRYIDENCDSPVGLDRLAAIAGLSKFHFLRVFARVAGASPYRYLLQARLRRAAVEIAATDRRISDIAFGAGFGDLSTFNAQFKRTFGSTPVDWRRNRGP